MKAIHLEDLLRNKGLPRSPFAEPQSGLRAALMLLFEMLRLALAFGLALVVLVFDLLWPSEDERL